MRVISVRQEQPPETCRRSARAAPSETIGSAAGRRRIPALGRVGIAFVLLRSLRVALSPRRGRHRARGRRRVLVAAGVPAARAGLRPVGALARAALPLLLPLFVFVAAGVVKSRP